MAKRSGGRNALVVPGSGNIINQFKNEIAAELGITNYDQLDKGALPARVHGMVGGTMTKRLVEMGQQMLSGQSTNQTNLDPQKYVQDMQKDIINGTVEAYANAPVVPTLNQGQKLQ